MDQVTISKENMDYTVDLLITMTVEEIAEETGKDSKEVLTDFLCSKPVRPYTILIRNFGAMDHPILPNYIWRKYPTKKEWKTFHKRPTVWKVMRWRSPRKRPASVIYATLPPL